MNAAITLIRTLGPGRLAAIAGLSALVLGFVAFAAMRISQPQMATLFSDLALEDSTAIVTELESQNIPFELRQDGAIIRVPESEVLRLRMRLAESGLPAGGGVGYELFDKADSLGTTSFVQNLNRVRALEGELARTIRSIDRVKAARVHLVLPDRRLFARESSEPTASIMLKLRGQLATTQIKAIQHIVASAVKDMKPEHVSIVDDRGDLLASGAGGGENSVTLTAIEERNRELEERMRQQVESIVGSIVGPGAVKVRVSAELDLSRSTETSDVYDPDGQVVRSSQSREESSASGNTNGGGVSVGNELPGANANDGAGGASDQNSKAEEVVNYEISKRTRTEIQEPGSIKRLSVAVLVDGIYGEDENKRVTYAPRPQEQLDKIAALVRSAVGFNRERGDSVEVVNLRFAPSSEGVEFSDGGESFLNLTKDDYFRFAEIAVLGVMALLIFFFVVRPLLRRALTPEEPHLALETAAEGGQAGAALAGRGGDIALPSPDGEGREGGGAVPTSVTQLIDSARLTGELHETSVRKVADLVKGNPDEAIGIIRQWIQNPA